MRHRKSTKILSRTSAARKALLRDLATNMVFYGSIQTTAAKARILRPQIERMVTVAKRNTLASRRLLLQRLHTHAAVKRLLEEIAPAMEKRRGGYTRTVKLGARVGDGAEIVSLEFIR